MAALRLTTTSLPSAARISPATSFSTSSPSLKLPTSGRRRGVVRMSATPGSSYAGALADLAKSNNTLDSTSADIEKIEKMFADPAVSKFFANPTIKPETKKQVLEDIAKSSELLPTTANFLSILVDADRMDIIKDIITEFEKVYNTLTDTELAVVSSVVQLDSQHLAQIAKQVQKLTGAKNVRIKTAIDPNLVAGFTVRYGSSGSKMIDMSVKKQLEEIASQLDLSDIQLAV